MQAVIVVIVEEDGCRLGVSLDEAAALTLVAVSSEDPVCWDDVVAYWPRYHTPPVPEFADSLALECVDFAAARGALDRHDSWVVIDLVRRRIITGRDMEPIGRDQAFAMVVEESGQQHCPLSVHLPPWWEMFEHADPSVLDRPRETPLSVCRVNREVLFGAAMLEELARRILDIVESDEWRASGASEHGRAVRASMGERCERAGASALRFHCASASRLADDAAPRPGWPDTEADAARRRALAGPR